MKTLLLLMLMLLATPVAAQSSTPQPIPLPTQDMMEQMAEANAMIEDLPVDLSSPDGLSIVPNENGRILFGYIKWILSPASADQWAGPLAPIFQHIGFGLGMMFTAMTIYTAMYVISNIGSWVGWLLETARKTLDLVLQGLQAAPFVLAIAVIIFIAYTIIGEEGVTNWIEENLSSVIDKIYDLITQLTGGA